MKCAVHADRDAAGFCRNCGKAMCSECSHPVHQVLYCEDCLSAAMGQTQPPLEAHAGMAGQPSAQARAGVSPGLAFFLGFVPGLGAIYNGEYNKALIHIVVFSAMIVGLNSDIGEGATVALALSLAGFIFYMAIDAHRTAKAKLAGAPAPDPLEAWGKEKPVGPLILIALGIIFLLDRFGWFSFSRIFDFWPVILILVGVLMLRNRLWRSS